MNKTLRIAFSLKNTYRVNSILYSLKQIPLIKKILPQSVYKVMGLKIFANILSVIWEILSVFLGKFLYFIIMITGIGALYKTMPADSVFLHILLFLTTIGSFSNTHMFNPSRDKYYAIFLMRMNARTYTLTSYTYSILKILVGFLPFSIYFGRASGIPLWVCVIIPFFVAGAKMTVAAYSLWDYERKGFCYNENMLGKMLWIVIGILLAAAYGLPAIGIAAPHLVVYVIMVAAVPLGIVSAFKIYSFHEYREIQQQLQAQSMYQMDMAANATRNYSQKSISADTGITSSRKGFEYLNELFIKRHQKVLWKATQRISAVCSFLILGGLLLFYVRPETRKNANNLLMTFLPYFVFIMYAINRGTNFTRVLFMNCDHSLLTYSFYKQPKMILKLFRIRLREIIKVNLVPALIIGCGLALLLYASGGTDNVLNYVVLIVSIVCMSIFFSVHYLTIYYIFQPYNAGTEMKSGTYQIVLSATYIVCFCMMKLRMPTPVFGLLAIVFCIAYSIAACVLVYRYAPKTFRLRT
ncbi:hypothetical protein NXH76_04370 [Blautia schinkii]|nr:hypothetical protein [Blautia schinkii]